MRAAAVSVAALALLCLACSAQQAGQTVPQRIRAASVTVLVSPDGAAWQAVGSGTLFKAKGGTLYCLTCAHCTPAKMGAKLAQFPGGGKKPVVHEVDVVARDEKEDICVLRVKGAFAGAAFAHLAKDVPGADTPIYHCGSYVGAYHHSVSKGEIQAAGDIEKGQEFDRFDATLYSGSSGGGVFLQDTGAWIGLLRHGPGQDVLGRVGSYIPVRRVRAWLEAQGLAGVIDPAAEIKKQG